MYCLLFIHLLTTYSNLVKSITWLFDDSLKFTWKLNENEEFYLDNICKKKTFAKFYKWMLQL